MKVCLTNDVESYTGDYAAEVYANGLGLPLILDTCQQYGIRGTHFVEALGATRWGRDPLRRICEDLAAAGQDIQLHVHPVVADIEGFEDIEDVLCHRDLATQCMLLQRGLDELAACGVTDVTAFRAGDLGANTDTLEAMKAVGLTVSANRDLDQKSSIRTRLNKYFRARNDWSEENGILDLPVTAIRSPLAGLDGPYRHLEIAAMGGREMCDALTRLEVAGYAAAGILTHPGEFFGYVNGRPVPIRKNVRRLERVAAFVADHPRMMFAGLDEIAAELPPAGQSPPAVRGALGSALVRVGEQVVDRVAVRVKGRVAR